MAGLMYPDILGAVNQGFDRGQGLQFNRLAGQAIADPDNASGSLGLAAAINPGKALQIQGDLQSTQDAKLKKIAGAANYVLSAYKSGNPQQVQGAYQAVRPYLQQLSHEHGDGAPPPEQFSDDMLPKLYQIVGQAGGPPKDQLHQVEGVVVAPGGALVDKTTGKTLYQATDKPPAAIQSMEYLQQHPELAQFQVDQRSAMHPQKTASGGGAGGSARDWIVGYDDQGNGVRINKRTGDTVPLTVNGQPFRKPLTKTGAGPSVRPPNNEQANAAGFADRMINAGSELGGLEQGGYDPTNLKDRLATGVGGVIGNTLLSDQGQQYRQAEENWVRANLRKESGAAIGKDEMASEVRNYFPQAGDRPDVVQQKAKNRQILEQNMVRTAGPAYHSAAAPRAQATVHTQDGQATSGPHNVGDVLMVNGKQYRVTGGDPNDPEVEPL